MAGMRIPFYRRFGFFLFMLIAVLFLSAAASLYMTNKGDYKGIADRVQFQRNLYFPAAELLTLTPEEEWPAILQGTPLLFPGQRWILFTAEGGEILAKNPNDYVLSETYAPRFPHPYAADPPGDEELLEFLRSLDKEGKDDYRRFRTQMRTMESEAGWNRLIIMGREIRLDSGEGGVLLLVSDATDELIQNRAIKERYLLSGLYIMFLGTLLTFALAGTAVRPVRRLHHYARAISENPASTPSAPRQKGRMEIGEICDILRTQMKEQRRRTEQFRRFSSDTVHELKTPLTAIRSGLEMLEESEDPKERKELYSLLYRRIGRMEDLMNGIYNLGKVETSADEKDSTDPVSILAEGAGDFAPRKSVTDVKGNLSGIRLPLSPPHFRLILENLLSNAVSFSSEPGSVSVGAKLDQGKFLLTVSDRGPGIGEEHRDRLTERFYSVRKNKDGHLGLGLSLIQAVLDSCGGTLEYGNRPKGGAYFSVRIPTEPPSSPPSPAAVRSSLTETAPERSR